MDCPRDTNGDGDCGQRLCPVCNAEREFIEGRAHVDWDRRGAIILDVTGEVIGYAMTDLSDETLARGVG